MPLATNAPRLIPSEPPITELTYPISPDYIAHWNLERAVAEIIANAIDADPEHFTISYAGGVLEITDTAPSGVGAEGMILGFSDKRGRDDQIGQFGEGLKVATLVLARSREVGEVFIETVGYAFAPAVVDQATIGGLNIPSRSSVPTKVLCWRLWPCARVAGTRIRMVIDESVARAAQGRFLHLSEPGTYAAPTGAGRVILTGKPGRVYIGGVLVSERAGLCCSYDLSLAISKSMQNRDRTIIDGPTLDAAIGAVLAECADRAVFERLVDAALDGSLARAEAAVFHRVNTAGQRRLFHEIGAARFGGAATFFIDQAAGAQRRDNEAEASLDLVDRGYKEIKTPHLENWTAKALLTLLEVPSAGSLVRSRAKRKTEQATYLKETDLSDSERSIRDRAIAHVRAVWGAVALDRVRVYERVTLSSGECPDFAGFYEPGSGAVNIRRDQLVTIERAIGVLVHEAAHRLAHRYPRRVGLRYSDHVDRSRGFEQALGSMAAQAAMHLVSLIGLEALGAAALEPDIDAEAAAHGFEATPGFHYTKRNGWYHPVSEAGAAAGALFAQAIIASAPAGHKTITRYAADNFVSSVTVRTFVAGAPAGRRYREMQDLVGPAGLSPAVFWLATTGPGQAYAKRHGKSRPAAWKFPSDILEPARAFCATVAKLGGEWAALAAQIRSIVDGCPLDLEDASWQRPFVRLVELERERLGLESPDEQVAAAAAPNA